GPGCSAVERLDEADEEAAGDGGAARDRVVVVEEPQVGGVAAGAGLDADPGQEVIDGAGRPIDGDADHRGPGLPVHRGAHHDVVAGAPRAEPAIVPHRVHLAVRVDLGRGQL